MKYLSLIFLFVSSSLKAAPTIDPRYDHLEGKSLIFQLIYDRQWNEAQYIFDDEKEQMQKQAPSDFHLIKGLFLQHQQLKGASTEEFESSLKIQYSDLALEKVLENATLEKNAELGFKWLEKYLEKILSKRITNEIAFLNTTASEVKFLSRSLTWMENYLQKGYNFQVLKLYTEVLIKNQIRNEARITVEKALESEKIKSPEEALSLAEIFLNAGFETDIHGFLERSRLRFPSSELVKLNLAQVMFKKELHSSALALLSELKMDDGVLSVQLELMNLLKVQAYSLFHRLQIKESSLHLKSWFVYFINNEDWSLLYSLYPKYSPTEKWAQDEINYAVAYSAQYVNDTDQARYFINKVKGSSFTQKKAKLLESIRTRPN